MQRQNNNATYPINLQMRASTCYRINYQQHNCRMSTALTDIIILMPTYITNLKFRTNLELALWLVVAARKLQFSAIKITT